MSDSYVSWARALLAHDPAVAEAVRNGSVSLGVAFARLKRHEQATTTPAATEVPAAAEAVESS